MMMVEEKFFLLEGDPRDEYVVFGVFLLFGAVFDVFGLRGMDNLAGCLSSGCVWSGLCGRF
jgi:hypothetical protein